MLFSSLEFLLLFFPVAFGVHFLLPVKWRNYWLLFVSLFFYAWGEPLFVLLMIGSICINYVLARCLDSLVSEKKRKGILVLDVILNLGVLFIFKYLNFVTGILHDLFSSPGNSLSVTSIALPIGISFFTFQAMSYVIDVYRGDAKVERNIAFVGLYISFFPQLIAGPIVRYTTVMDQIRNRRITLSSFTSGMLRFMIGFNKKILLANVLAEVADTAFGSGSNSVLMAWLGALCYSLQIYFDFSGYSDMAIGLGKMLGFRFLENFHYPYVSCTVTEFWRRWHISLGTWFRDYVYFPLGGSRVSSRWKLVRNLLLVWTLTGIWHGADWTFLLWGLMYGILIIFEKLLNLPNRLEHASWYALIPSHVLTLLFVLLGWVIFRAGSLLEAVRYLSSMFGLFGNDFLAGDFIFHAREYIVFLIAGLLCAFPIGSWLIKKSGGPDSHGGRFLSGTGSVLQFIFFIVSLTMLVMNAHNPFIYFNF